MAMQCCIAKLLIVNDDHKDIAGILELLVFECAPSKIQIKQRESLLTMEAQNYNST